MPCSHSTREAERRIQLSGEALIPLVVVKIVAGRLVVIVAGVVVAVIVIAGLWKAGCLALRTRK